MYDSAIPRRSFLAPALAWAVLIPRHRASRPAKRAAQPSPGGPTTAPAGLVYARAGKGGVRRGSPRLPSCGEAILLDGSRLKVSSSGLPVARGGSMLLSPDAGGRWTVLYAEA